MTISLHKYMYSTTVYRYLYKYLYFYILKSYMITRTSRFSATLRHVEGWTFLQVDPRDTLLQVLFIL